MTPDQIKAAATSGNNGYADFPSVYVPQEVKAELARDGFTTQISCSIYYFGARVYAPKAIRAGRPD